MHAKDTHRHTHNYHMPLGLHLPRHNETHEICTTKKLTIQYMEYSTKYHEYANSSGRVPASSIHCDSAVNFLLQLAHSFSTLLHCFGLQWHSGCIIHTIPLVNFFTALDFNGIAGALDTIFQDFSLSIIPIDKLSTYTVLLLIWYEIFCAHFARLWIY